MPPRVVPLALAGRRLTAPPEGYGPKKEQQIKGWLKAVPISSFELAQEPAVEDLRVRRWLHDGCGTASHGTSAFALHAHSRLSLHGLRMRAVLTKLQGLSDINGLKAIAVVDTHRPGCGCRT